MAYLLEGVGYFESTITLFHMWRIGLAGRPAIRENRGVRELSESVISIMEIREESRNLEISGKYQGIWQYILSFKLETLFFVV